MDAQQVINNYGVDWRTAEQVAEVYNHLSYGHSLSFDDEFDYDFDGLQCFLNNLVSYPEPVIAIEKNSKKVHLTFVQVNRSYSQIWGIVQLKRNYGHIFIKNKTLLDKIQYRINPININFEDDRAFSKRFLVISNDETQARLLLNTSLRNYISNIETKEIIIEIREDHLIIGNEKNVSPETAGEMAKFMSSVAGMY